LRRGILGFTDPSDIPANALQAVIITTLPPARDPLQVTQLVFGRVAHAAGRQQLWLASAKAGPVDIILSIVPRDGRVSDHELQLDTATGHLSQPTALGDRCLNDTIAPTFSPAAQ